jgi:hypothetical protein
MVSALNMVGTEKVDPMRQKETPEGEPIRGWSSAPGFESAHQPVFLQGGSGVTGKGIVGRCWEWGTSYVDASRHWLAQPG